MSVAKSTWLAPDPLNDAEAARVIREAIDSGKVPAKSVRDRLTADWKDAAALCNQGDPGIARWLEAVAKRDPAAATAYRKALEAAKATPADTLPFPAPAEAEDDPHRIARAFLAKQCTHPDGHTLRYHQGEFLEWDGAYRPTIDKDVNARLAAHTKVEFDRLTAEKCKADGGGGSVRPTSRKVTNSLIGNVRLALGGEVRLPGTVVQPTWIGDDPPTWRADEMLPTSTTLVHLPSFADGKPATTKPTPKFFAPYVLGYGFDAKAETPTRWLDFLGQLWPDDPESIGTLQEWFGLNLLPDTRHQKILALIGPKRSGKGTIARTLTEMIGADNVCNPTLSSIGTNFGLWPMIGKLAAIITDARLSGRADIAQVVENLLTISGEDGKTIDRKHLTPWTGRLAVRFTMISNEIPRLTEASGALAGRMVILRLTRSFYGKEDKRLSESIRSELPGVLLWAIDGWKRLRDRGHFIQPESGSPLVREMEELASPVGMFVNEMCIVAPGAEIGVSDLFSAWKAWCVSKNRENVGDEQAFGAICVR